MAEQRIKASISENSKIKDPETGEKVPNPYAGHSAIVAYDFGSTLEDLIELITGSGKSVEEAKKIVYSNALGTMVITVQSGIRRMLNAGKDSEEIQKWADNWIPGLAADRAKKSLAEKSVKLAENADVDDIEETIAMLEELKSQRAN